MKTCCYFSWDALEGENQQRGQPHTLPAWSGRFFSVNLASGGNAWLN